MKKSKKKHAVKSRAPRTPKRVEPDTMWDIGKWIYPHLPTWGATMNFIYGVLAA